MFKNLKLGTKIAGGFGIVLLITLGLGLTTLRNMRGIGEETTIMAKELIPQVDVLVDLEQHIREMMYHLRGYGYTGDDSFLQSSKKSVEAIKHALAGAKTLASASPHLVKLKAETGTLEARMNEYFSLTDQTREKVEGLLSNRKRLDEAAATFMENAAGYLESQYKQMIGEIQSGAGEATLTERLEKITLIHKAVSTGSQVMTANFKAQILRDTAKTQEALSHFPEIDRIISLLLAKTTQEVNKKQLTEVQVAAKAYQAAIAHPSANWQALFEINNKRRDAGNSALTLTREITKNALARIDKTSEETMGSVSFASRMTAVGLGLAVALGVILAFFITRGITRVINRIVEALGDGAHQVASASGQVSSASQQMAEGASEQAASLEETSSSLEEMASMTKQNADNASQADNLVKEAAKLMEKAGQSMRELTISMADISGASEETSKIVKTIDEIAFQTNLLALNAAVEAARAGEAGAGFAVVADEVRNLAMRAAEAAKTTASLIEGTVKRVKDGSSLVSTTNEAYQDVAQNSMKVADLVAEIAAASREQAQGIEQLNKAVAEMDKVVQQNAASAEENASASEELSAQAEQMNHSVAELVALVGGAGNRSTVGLVALVRESGSRKRDDGILKGPEPKSKSTLMLPKRSAGKGKMGPATRALAPNQVIPLDESDLRDF